MPGQRAVAAWRTERRTASDQRWYATSRASSDTAAQLRTRHAHAVLTKSSSERGHSSTLHARKSAAIDITCARAAGVALGQSGGRKRSKGVDWQACMLPSAPAQLKTASKA